MIPVALVDPTPVARLKNAVDTPILNEPSIELTDVLIPDILTKLEFVKLWGDGETATNLPDESVGAISSSVIEEVATLTFEITLPVTSDTFALADVAPANVSNTILSFTWYPLPPVTIPTLSIDPVEVEVISITSS